MKLVYIASPYTDESPGIMHLRAARIAQITAKLPTIVTGKQLS